MRQSVTEGAGRSPVLEAREQIECGGARDVRLHPSVQGQELPGGVGLARAAGKTASPKCASAAARDRTTALTASAAHWGVLSVWHRLHAFGAPILIDRSGRGTGSCDRGADRPPCKSAPACGSPRIASRTRPLVEMMRWRIVVFVFQAGRIDRVARLRPCRVVRTGAQRVSRRAVLSCADRGSRRSAAPLRTCGSAGTSRIRTPRPGSDRPRDRAARRATQAGGGPSTLAVPIVAPEGAAA